VLAGCKRDVFLKKSVFLQECFSGKITIKSMVKRRLVTRFPIRNVSFDPCSKVSFLDLYNREVSGKERKRDVLSMFQERENTFRVRLKRR